MAITGAEVTFTPLRQQWNAYSWRVQDWETLDAATKRSQTDSDGRFHVDSPLLPGESGAIWITHSGYTAVFRCVAESSVVQSIDLMLSDGMQIVAQVVDGQKAAVSGAAVDQYANGWPEDEADPDTQEMMCLRVYHRRGVTDDQGRASIPFLGQEHCLVASKGILVAEPYRDEPRPRVEFVLQPSFSLRVHLQTTDGSTPSKSFIMTVGAAILGHSETHYVGGLSPQDDGSIPATRLPILETATHYAVYVQGGEYLAQGQSIGLPKAGETVDVAFTLQRACQLDVLVNDPNGKPIENARVYALWQAPGRNGTSEFTSDKEGKTTILGIPKGPAEVIGQAKGYASRRVGPLLLPDTKEATLVLPRAGTVQGRVLHDGQAVPDFTITYWQGRAYDMVQKSFTGKEDGSFALEEAPLGQVTLFASSGQYQRGDPVTVDVRQEAAAEVVLDVVTPVWGFGRVIDAASGAPIDGAHVKPHTNYLGQLLAAWGPGEHTDSEGRFRIQGWPKQDARLILEAEGHAQLLIGGFVSPNQEIDFGTIAMQGSTAMAISLRSPARRDWSGWTVSVYGPSAAGPIPLSGEGTAIVGDCTIGMYTVTIQPAVGQSRAFRRYLRTQDELKLEFTFPEGYPLIVELEATGSASLPNDGNVTLFYPDPEGGSEWVQQVEEIRGRREIEFVEVPAGPLTVRVAARSGESLALAEHEMLSTEGQRVRLKLAPDRRCLRVVDAQGSRLSAVDVYAICSSRGPWFERGTTDLDGRWCMPEPPCRELLLSLVHPQIGQRFGVSWLLGADPSAVETFELRVDQALRVRLLDGEVGLQGIRTMLHEKLSTHLVRELFSGPGGALVYEPLAEGDYGVQVFHPGIWPVEETFAASLDAKRVLDMQVRRLGSLRLTAQNGQGLSVQDIEIDLVCKEGGERLSKWAHDGQLKLPQPISTGQTGELLVEDIPHGEYTWEAKLADGNVLQGVVVVEIGKTAQVYVPIP